MTQKDELSHRIFRYAAMLGGAFVVYYLLGLIPGSSPFKYVASLVSVAAIIHTIRKDYMEAKGKGERPSIALDKLLAMVALLVALLWSIKDDHTKYITDLTSQRKSDALAKAQNDLAQMTNDNTRRAAADAAKTRAIASQTKADATRIKQDERVVVLDQRVLTALAQQNNKIARQNTLEQRRDALRQESDAHRLSLVTQEQAGRTRDANKAVALHSDILQASRSVHNLSETLYGFERTLNPIKDARLNYTIVVPLNNPDPQIQAFKGLLDKAVQEYQASSPAKDTSQITGVGGTFQTEQGLTGNTSRLILSRGSVLFPTDPKSFLGSLFNAPMKVGFWHKSSWKRLPNGQIKLSNMQPDMELEVSTHAAPELWYYPVMKMLVLAYNNVPVATDISTGKITSLPDLEGSWIVMRENNYDSNTETFSYAPDDEVRRQCVVRRVSLLASNRLFLFDFNDLQHSIDGSGKPMCTFTFDSGYTSKTRTELAPSFWDNIVQK